MENCDRRFVVNGDVQLALERNGTGSRHVLFAHGWISSRRMWREVVERLPGFTAWRLDFRGCGESDRPLEGHDLPGYTSDLRAAAEAIGEPLIVVGHSMGARVAQYLALERPAWLSGMLLVAPGVARGAVTIPRHREMTERAFGSRRRILAFQSGAMAKPIAPADVERIVEDALFAQREHWFGWYDAGRTLDFSERLHEIDVPVGIVAGGADPLIPPGRLDRELVDVLPGTVCDVVAGVGHNVPLEAPDAVVAGLQRLVDRTDEKRPNASG